MNNFDSWNELKKKIDSDKSKSNCFPKEGEVWMSILGKNVGFEQNGSSNNFSRPLLIVKKFNNHMFWSTPLSTKQKGFDFYHNFTDLDGNKVSIILAQLKLISIKRVKRKLYELPSDQFTEVKEKIKAFL